MAVREREPFGSPAGAGSCAATGSGCGTSSGTILAIRLLAHVTSPPLRSVSTTRSPSSLCPLTDSVPPEVMKTISAEATDAPPTRRTHVASAIRAVFSTSIGTGDPTIWLADCPETLQSSRLLGLHVDVEHPEPELARVTATRLKGAIQVEHQVHHVGLSQLCRSEIKGEERGLLGLGSELRHDLVTDLERHLLRRREEVHPRVVAQIKLGVLLRIAERDRRGLLGP